jgi:hypothetical protein
MEGMISLFLALLVALVTVSVVVALAIRDKKVSIR